MSAPAPTFTRRPVTRYVDVLGFISTSGGEWVATTPSGRQFTHKTKSVAAAAARTFIACGEDEAVYAEQVSS